MQEKNQFFDEDYDEAVLEAERFIEENLHSGMSRMQLLEGASKIADLEDIDQRLLALLLT